MDRGSTPEPVVDTTKTKIFSEMRSVCDCNYLMTRFTVAVRWGTHQRIRIYASNMTLETDSSTFPCDVISSVLCISCLCGVEDEKTTNLFCVRRGIWHVWCQLSGYQIICRSWETKGVSLHSMIANVKSIAMAMEETGLDVNQPAKSIHLIPHRRSISNQGTTSFSSCVGHLHAWFSNGDVSSNDL